MCVCVCFYFCCQPSTMSSYYRYLRMLNKISGVPLEHTNTYTHARANIHEMCMCLFAGVFLYTYTYRYTYERACGCVVQGIHVYVGPPFPFHQALSSASSSVHITRVTTNDLFRPRVSTSSPKPYCLLIIEWKQPSECRGEQCKCILITNYNIPRIGSI